MANSAHPATAEFAAAVRRISARELIFRNLDVSVARRLRPHSSREYVTTATVVLVTDERASWLVLVVRVPAEPSRHRVAVWRELRKIGAVPLGQGAWAAPDVPGFAAGISRVGELADRGAGQLVVLQATGRTGQDAAWLEAAFTELRQEEWTEFIADCGKFDAEIDKEFALQKLTMAELEEEEQTLDRLRRWHRELAARDVFGAPLAAEAQLRLKQCGERLEEFTDAVFQALHQF